MMQRMDPLTENEIMALDQIQDLADQIYTLAAPLDKYPRHPLSDAARLIKWVCYDYHSPGDPDATRAIKTLRAALSLEQKARGAP